MTSFKLASGATTYTLTMDGSVTTSAGPFGTWTTDGKTTNQIVLTKKADGSTVAIAVKWSFNASNQLCVAQDANPAFNFTVSAVRPLFRLDSGNKLHVTPAPGGTLFEFSLVCGFALTKDADLEITINGQKSTIKGVPTSNKAYFGYSFRDKDASIPAVLLAFSGEWVRDATNPNQIVLTFNFKVDAAVYKFAMPTSSTTGISPKNNLLITGVKNGQGWGVTIDGALTVRKDDHDFSLVFALDQQHTASGVKTTTIEIKAVFAPDDTSRLGVALDLYIGSTKTPTSKRVTVKGEGHVSLGDTGLDLTFAYGNTQDIGHAPVIALAVQATFSWSDGKLILTYEKDGATTEATLSTEFSLGDVRVEGYLNITKEDGQQAGVSGAIGLSW